MASSGVLVPIQNIIIGSGGSGGGVSFTNIPQTSFTHLLLYISVRSAAPGLDSLGIILNGDNANRSSTKLRGSGTSLVSDRSTYRDLATTPGSPQTASAFSSVEILIPNYKSSNFKQLIVNAVSTYNNSSIVGGLITTAFLWKGTAAINSIAIDNSTSGQAYVEFSTLSLYGLV